MIRADASIGRKNVLFGWIWVLIWILFGVYLEIKLGNPQWGIHHTRLLRKLLSDTHSHALGLALLNILYGLTIDGAYLSAGIKNQGAWLAILGTALFPLSMLAVMVEPTLFLATYIAVFFLFIALWIIIVGYLRKAPPAPAPE